MLENMEYAGIVPGQGLEGDAEGLVFFVPLQPHQAQTGLVMGHLVENGVQFRQLHLSCDGEAMDMIGIHGGFLLVRFFYIIYGVMCFCNKDFGY